MAMKRDILIKRIADNLAFSSKATAMENVLGLFDSNRVAQDFFKGLFALVFKYKNLEELDKLNDTVTYPAIDLGDIKERIAFQITTKGDSNKIKNTITKFIKYRLYESYDRLIIFIIGENTISHRTKFNTENKFVFDSARDIWDDIYLIKEINKLDVIDDLQQIEEFLKKNLDEYKFPERLFDHDIKDCIFVLKRDLTSWLDDVKPNTSSEIVSRDEDFILAKNKVNNISWEFFKEKIRGHINYNKAIFDFLSNPINKSTQDDYFIVTAAIQKYFLENQKTIGSLDNLFRKIFDHISCYDDCVNNIKIKILLHNMYFNCDIGNNPK
jgi:hypothetical protein